MCVCTSTVTVSSQLSNHTDGVHIRLLKQPNKIHVCDTCTPKDYKFMKVYCVLIVPPPDIYAETSTTKLFYRSMGAKSRYYCVCTSDLHWLVAIWMWWRKVMYAIWWNDAKVIVRSNVFGSTWILLRKQAFFLLRQFAFHACLTKAFPNDTLFTQPPSIAPLFARETIVLYRSWHHKNVIKTIGIFSVCAKIAHQWIHYS